MMSPSLRIQGMPPIVPSGRSKNETVEMVNEHARFVMGVLAGEIALPGSVTIKFVKTAKTHVAEAVPGAIHLTPIAFKYLYNTGEYGHDAFMGIIGHELSHVSDFFTGLGPQNNWAQVSSKVIGEGKADKVGEYIGGERYKKAFIKGLSLSERDQAYTDLFLSESRQYAAKRFAEKHLRIGYETPLSRPCGRYMTGYALVDDVMQWSGKESIFDVHAEPVAFFMDTLRDNMLRTQVGIMQSEPSPAEAR